MSMLKLWKCLNGVSFKLEFLRWQQVDILCSIKLEKKYQVHHKFVFKFWNKLDLEIAQILSTDKKGVSPMQNQKLNWLIILRISLWQKSKQRVMTLNWLFMTHCTMNSIVRNQQIYQEMNHTEIYLTPKFEQSEIFFFNFARLFYFWGLFFRFSCVKKRKKTPKLSERLKLSQ